jgi:transcription elongation GreA/GreB family factor
MSRAFIKEDDLAESATLPERQISDQPNYVTARGLRLLETRVAELMSQRSSLLNREDANARQRLSEIERDLRYYAARLESAKLVPPPPAIPEQVTFGCQVTVAVPGNGEATYTLVGEDEAEVEHGLISWVSPLGKALLGAREGELVVWQRPAGELELEVIEITAPD